MLKLPKSLESDDRAAVIEKRLNENSILLWSGGTVRVPKLTLTASMEKALSISRRAGQLRGGLESIESTLRKEKSGLMAIAKKQKQKVDSTARLSRLLIMSTDGSERFYRHCEMLLSLHADRMIGIQLNAQSQLIGQKFFGKEAQVKALLVSHKDFVVRVLESLAES
ncbi:MAG: hypothetical protein RJB13_151 [Pseudomonadota bacterium]|jgi:hypothetical protein